MNEDKLCPKFIIEDGNLILSKVAFHYQLVTDKSKVKGGGWFKYDHENKSFTFYDDSFDYGKAKLEDVKECVENDKIFTNSSLTHSIATKYKFRYNTGCEIMDLN